MRFLLVAADKSSKIPIEVPSELTTKSVKRASKVSKVKVENQKKKSADVTWFDTNSGPAKSADIFSILAPLLLSLVDRQLVAFIKLLGLFIQKAIT